jgi:hypothetical protein
MPKLLPPEWKLRGAVTAIAGAALCAVCFAGHIEIPWLRAPVFALLSWFARPKFLILSSTNLTNEIALFLTLSGLCMAVFSREKDESPEIAALRHRSMFYASLTQSVYFGICIWFTFGFGFILALLLGAALLLVFHLGTFNYLLYRHRIKRSEHD